MQWPFAMLTLVLVLDLFTWTTLAAMAVRVNSLIVHGIFLAPVTIATVRLLE